MIASARSSSLLVTLLLGGSSLACSPGDDGGTGSNNTGGATAGGTGGTSDGSGGTGTGGGDTSDGGTPGSGGGDGTGGGSGGGAFECPSGYQGMQPTLPANAGEPVAVAEGDRFLEGPVWDGSHLYVSYIQKSGGPAPASILRLDGENFNEFVKDELAGTNGLAIRGDGKLVAASQRVNGLLLIEPADPNADPPVLVDEYMSAGFNSPNDLALRSDGNIYFTDPSYQCGGNCPQGTNNNRVYRVLPNGTVESIDPPESEVDNVEYQPRYSNPNGIALSLDENELFLAGDDGGISVFRLSADGSVESSSDFANYGDPNQVSSVDGMTLDCAGNLYVTEHTAGRVVVFSPDQEYIGQIQVGANVTNVAFGGAERKTLYITTYSSALYAVELDIPGLPY